MHISWRVRTMETSSSSSSENDFIGHHSGRMCRGRCNACLIHLTCDADVRLKTQWPPRAWDHIVIQTEGMMKGVRSIERKQIAWSEDIWCIYWILKRGNAVWMYLFVFLCLPLLFNHVEATHFVLSYLFFFSSFISFLLDFFQFKK